MYGTAKSTCELCLPQSPFAGMIRQSSFEQVNGGEPGFNETRPAFSKFESYQAALSSL